MQPFRKVEAVAVPMSQANVDTDQIIPARFLWRARDAGYGKLLFNDLRADAGGTPKPGFILNKPAYAEAKILVGDRNFGCGSSREHAVWALADAGFRAVIAPSFGDIFYNNSFKNGFLPIVLPEDRCAVLREALEVAEGANTAPSISIDLEAQTVTGPDGVVDHFEITGFRKEKLLAGADDIDFTLGHLDRITAFEARYAADSPWL